ncbi:DNA-directed RNA polymerase I subunit RPA1-like [Mizuhopecten yessoensis]|uniref:DNA-directed RNA polymerase I subunit RPA1-like n=1 Tax=Mizuhopecten yessoensis TaxID=6573 RepID=UPI000B459121|nr:DNA-directed RNA polymerase I subunit RPA1-like [Mizuhopecten yessoensis]
MDTDIAEQRLESLDFRFYLQSEIRSLSVKEITNSQTFDSLAHPCSGGLYDSALGPTDRDDVCGTCGQNFVHCPGHMGHIVLPLPVYNPVYFSTLYQVLRGSCFNCHRLTVSTLSTILFVKKMDLLNHGLLAAAGDLEDFVANQTEQFGKNAAAEEVINSNIETKVEAWLAETGKLEEIASVKNVEAFKNSEITNFIRSKLMLTSIACPHCKTKKRPIKQENNVKFLLAGKKAAKQKIAVKKKSMEDTESKKDDEDSLMEMPDMETTLPEEEAEEDQTTVTFDSAEQTYISPSQTHDHLQLLWKKDGVILKYLFHSLAKVVDDSPDIFFLQVIPVPPSRFRPRVCCIRLLVAGCKMLSVTFPGCVVSDCWWQDVKCCLLCFQGVLSQIYGTTLMEKLQSCWIQMQNHANSVLDCELDKLAKEKCPGVKQLLEKKEGLFRKNMMGKRVNYAARSVISPDPCINTNEIGVPEVFAKKLTYAQPVTPWNIQELRQMVINGPNVHPGACFVMNEDGFKTMLSANDKTQREAVAKQLLTPGANPLAYRECKKVYRHLKNGDVMLLNRQPTLHRPSIQAHKARVLPGEKTLRLHYANCKAYNADFDGDEMNAHFPQNELARAEAYTIASTDFQYLVPKDGTPLAGLIQDHMVSGVNLTLRGRFFTRQEYCQLVFSALVDKKGPVKVLPPSIIKPYKLWSGKQVLSTIILNSIPAGKEPLNLTGKSKITEKSWVTSDPMADLPKEVMEEMGESWVIIRGGELLCGVLDKGHYGPTCYGLIHCSYELYGGEIAGRLLTYFGRLFTNFLQMIRGFTLGVEDILVTTPADKKRQQAIVESTQFGDDSAKEALTLDSETDAKAMLKALKKAHFSPDDVELQMLDQSTKTRTDNTQNAIVKACMPKGLEKLFPQNNLQLMVQSGAKGSSVNCMQISCLLGQIELEGRRPRPMLSGKTLPSFMAYDTSPRAGGFVSGRFLTGIRPQEYFFHCMAGREGLIDTAVKTSRSGYLQRCLIKHLEGVYVNYDLTVRDSDGSVVQFYYGEDGLDILKTGFITPKMYPFLLENRSIVTAVSAPNNKDQTQVSDKGVRKWTKKIMKWRKHAKKKRSTSQRGSGFLNFCKRSKFPGSEDNRIEKNGRTFGACLMCNEWRALDDKAKKKYTKYTGGCPDPATAIYFPYEQGGVIPEKFESILKNFSSNELKKVVKDGSIGPAEFNTMMKQKLMKSLAEPGESVGALCAQSIGEPSTQMTLNTFHFAGRGEMNVTLGIPRLREILMVASANIKTPAMDIPVYPDPQARQTAKTIQTLFNKVTLAEVLEDISITEYTIVKGRTLAQRKRVFEIRFKFLPYRLYRERLGVTPASILTFIENTYIKRIIALIKRKMNDGTKRSRVLTSGRLLKKTVTEEDTSKVDDTGDQQADSDLEDMAGDSNAVADKEKKRHEEEKEYDEDVIEEDAKDEELEEQVTMDEESDEETNFNIEDDMGSEEAAEGHQNKPKMTAAMRINTVLKSMNVAEYKFDQKRQEWCQVKLQFGIQHSKVDVLSMLETDAKTAIVHQITGINKCFLTEQMGKEKRELHLKTEGINIQELYKYADILDMSQLYTNDIHAMAGTYGIEAASRVIVKEIQNVFGAYGIEVDYRHLCLLADYMTFEGSYKPFNRKAMETSTSPLQKMSFETTMHFLVKASIHGTKDNLRNPSSQLVAGRLVSCGTGIVDVLQPFS